MRVHLLLARETKNELTCMRHYEMRLPCAAVVFVVEHQGSGETTEGSFEVTGRCSAQKHLCTYDLIRM
jgi:hypothetical protein